MSGLTFQIPTSNPIGTAVNIVRGNVGGANTTVDISPIPDMKFDGGSAIKDHFQGLKDLKDKADAALAGVTGSVTTETGSTTVDVTVHSGEFPTNFYPYDNFTLGSGYR